MLNNQPVGDLWHLKDNDAESQFYGRTFHFDFSYIHSEEMKSVVKDYVCHNWKTGINTLSKLKQDVSNLRHFVEFAAQHRIDSFRELDNTKVDLYLSYEDKVFRKIMDIRMEEESKEILMKMESERLLKKAFTEYEDQRCAELIEKYKDFEPEEPLPSVEEFMRKLETRQKALDEIETAITNV